MNRSRNIRMNPLWILLLAGLLIFSLSACDGSKAKNVSTSRMAGSFTSEVFTETDEAGITLEGQASIVTSEDSSTLSLVSSASGNKMSSVRQNSTSKTSTGSKDDNRTSSEPVPYSSKENEEPDNVTSDVVVNPEQDFVLTIAVEETTLPQGENFTVNVELKNNSKQDHEISYSILFDPRIPGWMWHPFGNDSDFCPMDPPFYQRIFEAGSVIQNTSFQFGNDLEPGTYELRFRAEFYLNWYQDNQQEIRILSNPITITVQ